MGNAVSVRHEAHGKTKDEQVTGEPCPSIATMPEETRAPSWTLPLDLPWDSLQAPSLLPAPRAASLD